MVSIEIFAIEMFLNHQAGEHHISFYSTDCYICHLNFLTARWNNSEMLCM